MKILLLKFVMPLFTLLLVRKTAYVQPVKSLKDLELLTLRHWDSNRPPNADDTYL